MIASRDLLADKVPRDTLVEPVDARWLMRLARDPAVREQLEDAIREVQPGPLEQVLAAIKAAFDTTKN